MRQDEERRAVPDLKSKSSQRTDLLALVLTLTGLAGLVVSVTGFVDGSGLWPSFSGERVYTSQAILSERPAPQPSVEAAPKPSSPEPLVIRETEKPARSACDGKARAIPPTTFEARKRELSRRLRLLSRRPSSAFTSSV